MHHDLSADRIAALLGTRRLGHPFHLLEHADSTNSEIARLVQQGAEHGTVVCTDRQTAGRGRHGRHWHARPGQSLCFSILLRPASPPRRDGTWLPWIPLTSAMGVADGIRRSAGTAPALKWPNDLLLGDHKIGGLLCESLGSPDRAPLLIIGIGLNVNLQAGDFPEELRGTATSLAIETGRVLDRARLLAEILNELEPRLDAVCRGDLEEARQAYRGSCATIGRMVRIERHRQPPLEGLAVDIADSGALRVEPRVLSGQPRAHGVVEVLTGDVVHLRPLVLE